ncbi:MAG: hypothetical protein ACTH3S_08985 [Marinobacter sp.]|uniref:hypothetical protein n=1 Tax=Marinobacter sp. TaxID=50741 RepID=UPI003F99D598
MGSLLTSLRKYRPRENTNPVENFITEAFAWLLRKDDGLSHSLINHIAQQLSDTDKKFSLPSGDVIWSTQANYNGVFPDMEAKWPGMRMVFEHKVWAGLHDNQLKNYRDYHQDAGTDYRLILITGHHSQHAQNPDLALCWDDIYVLFENHLEVSRQSANAWIIKDFLQLLKSEGLGPAAPISHTAIFHYQEAISLSSQLEALMHIAIKNEWSMPGYRSEVKKKEGVLGIQFSRQSSETGADATWTPGVFVGFFLDGWDHRVENRLKDGLKMCLKISISGKYHADYPEWAEYKELIKDLADQAAKSSRGWVFYNHRAEANPFNPWHPLYLEYPMIDVFRGTETMAEQEQRFIKLAEEVLGMLTACESFRALEEKFKNKGVC